MFAPPQLFRSIWLALALALALVLGVQSQAQQAQPGEGEGEQLFQRRASSTVEVGEAREIPWAYWAAGALAASVLLALGMALPLWRMNRKMAAARDHAESANRAKERFVAMVSHELRTPMNGVLGFTSLLQRTPLTPEQAEYVHLIETSTTSLSKLISDLLDFSKIEAGRTEFERLPFELRAAMEDIVNFFAPTADAKGLSLQYAPHEPLPRYVLGDPTRLRQILVNLLDNALKFTEKGSVSLRIAQEEVLEETQRTAGWLQFIVRDTGPGMAESELARAFEPYAQADASVRRRYGGTGLGLTISRRLAEQMGGQLHLSSTPGKGTLAVLRLPLEVTEAPAKTPVVAPPEPGAFVKPAVAEASTAKLRILVAEDDKISSRLMLALLRKLGYDTAVAVDNGRLAVEHWGREFPNLIFMDMQMPEMGGLEAIAAIRQEEEAQGRTGKTWLIALSASAQDQIKLDCLAAGADSYLTKPVTLAQIQKTLEELAEE